MPAIASNRRRFLSHLGCLACGPELTRLHAAALAARPPKRVAVITTVFGPNSHAEMIAGRILEGFTLEGRGPRPDLAVASLYVDQRPPNDLSGALAEKHGFRVCASIEEALTLGGRELAVDGVLIIAEHGSYPKSETGQEMYPKRRFFEETFAVFRRHGRSVPVFSDKHLSWNWENARWIYDTARELKVPLMAGSSLPGSWRRPALELVRGTVVKEMVGLNYGGIEAYGFHALEMLQCLCERRKGGESGLAAVQCLEGDAIWQARDAGRFDVKLLEAALAAREIKREKPGPLERVTRNPTAFLLEYRDGFRGAILTLNRVTQEWCVAWREANEAAPKSTLFWLQEERPYGHFSFLVQGIERMMHTGRPAWPVERTLLTTGALHELHVSKLRGGERRETPHLAVRYQPASDWKQPPPPPPDQPRVKRKK